MQSRWVPIVACVVTLALVAFGQVCALGSLLARVEAPESALVVTTEKASDEHSGCTGDCDTNSEDGQKEGCPTGAASCCSTWGPPTTRISLALPALWTPLLDVGDVAVGLNVEQERAAEVALFQLDHPPRQFFSSLFISSIPRRGPPAIS